MFILKSTHTALLDAERKHCADLVAQMSEQISDLRKLVFVPAPTHMETLSVRTANAILDGNEVLPKEDPQREADDLAEANRILSGQYDDVEASW